MMVILTFLRQHVLYCHAFWHMRLYSNNILSIAVATIEADEVIASSDFLKSMGISP